MAVANKVHKQGLQHHALCHITMHPYISCCSRLSFHKLGLHCNAYILLISVRAKMKCPERTEPDRTGPDSDRTGPYRTGLHTIKSVPLRRTSTRSYPDMDRTRVGFASTRLTVFDVIIALEVYRRSRSL